MATSGVTTIGDRTIVYGGATGIDTSALINVAYEAKKKPSDTLQTKISENTSKMAGYSELQSLAQTVQSSISSLRKDYSSLSSGSMFDGRTGTLSSNTSTSPESLVDISIDSGAELGAHTVLVQQKAQTQIVTSYNQASKTVAYGMTGTFSIGIAGRTPTAVSVTPTMDLEDIAAAINVGSETSGVTASIAQVTSTQYQLVLKGADTNKAIDVSGVTGNHVMKVLGVVMAGGDMQFVLQAAQPSIVKLDGVTYTRDGTNLDDLIPGVNLTVKNSDPLTTVQLEIENDVSGIQERIESFVESYNTLRDFVLKNQLVQDGAVSEDAVLFADYTMKSLSYDMQALIARNYGSTSATYQNLRDLGVTLDGDGKLSINTTTLQDALDSNLDEVRAMFETSVTSSDTNFRMISNTSQTDSLSATIDITYSGGSITNVAVGGDNTLFDIDGTLITGKEGTIYEGMSFAYVGTTNASVTLTMQQGFADLLDNAIGYYADDIDGQIQDRIDELTSANTEMQTRSDDILERASDYRDKLIEKYASYEEQIARAKTILAQIQAILNASQNNN